MQQASHVCHRLIVSKEGDIDTPSSLGVNGADADGVERHDGKWFLVVNCREYGVRIFHCPYCGWKLV